MKVSDSSSNISKIASVSNDRRNIKSTDKTQGVSGKKDVVSISNKAKDFQSVMKALVTIPDIRQDKIDEMMRKYGVSNGSPGNDIAEKILKKFSNELE